MVLFDQSVGPGSPRPSSSPRHLVTSDLWAPAPIEADVDLPMIGRSVLAGPPADCSDPTHQPYSIMRAFDDIYARYADSVFRFAWRLVGRRDIAEEIAADAFLALHEHMDTIDVDQLPAWLFTVARHRAIDYWRRRSLEDRYLSALPSEPSTVQADSTFSRLLDHDSLKPVHRTCLRLRYAYGMSLAETARAIGLSETQVKGHLQYARHLLRKSLVEERE